MKAAGINSDRIDGEVGLNVELSREKRKGSTFAVGVEVGEEVGDGLLKFDIAHRSNYFYKHQPTKSVICHLL